MSTLLYGFAAGFIGYLPPSMINMSIVGISVKNNFKAGILFSVGALLVGGIQEWFSLACSDLIVKNEGVMNILEKSAIFVLIILGAFFIFKGIKEKRKKVAVLPIPKSNHKYFLEGLFTSLFNFLAIPYWVVIGALFGSKGWLSFEQPDLNYFIFGGFLGMMTLFLGYVLLSKVLAKKMTSVARNMNFILGVIFSILGSIQFIRIIL